MADTNSFFGPPARIGSMKKTQIQKSLSGRYGSTEVDLSASAFLRIVIDIT
jgi:hypothetical protein